MKKGDSMMEFIQELFPICRSITGEGLRQTLKIIQNKIPLQLVEIPSGTAVLDWTIPREWNIREAYLIDPKGRKVIDFRSNNLHVVNYSSPFRGKILFSELKEHLFTLPENPDWIPYRTSYYKDSWGFCLSQNQFNSLVDGEYEVVIDSSLEKGSLTYGEYFIQGESEEQILISCHCCHPSLANDNLSGIAVAVSLAQALAKAPKKYSYRFVFIPGTIGAIAWLAQNQKNLASIRHGIVLTGMGNDGPLTYKKSRMGNAEIDRTALQVLKSLGETFDIREFSPYGYDERQYCSPGFNLPVGRLSRTPYGEYPEYHTSADNMSFISKEKLIAARDALEKIFSVLEIQEYFINSEPYGEVQLGRRGLYRPSGGAGSEEMAFLWLLNLCDGTRSLFDIADQSQIALPKLIEAKNILVEKSLLHLAKIGERISARDSVQ